MRYNEILNPLGLYIDGTIIYNNVDFYYYIYSIINNKIVFSLNIEQINDIYNQKEIQIYLRNKKINKIIYK